MKTWFKVWLVLFAVLLLLSVVVPAMAAELQSADAALPAGTETIETESMEASDQESESLHPEATTESEEVESDVQSTEEVREVIEYNLELSEPIQVIPVEPAPV